MVLSPAYDICPQARTGRDARQAMAFAADGGRVARLGALVASAANYHVDRVDAQAIVEHQVAVIRDGWDEVCEAGELTGSQRAAFMERQFLNPGVFD